MVYSHYTDNNDFKIRWKIIRSNYCKLKENDLSLHKNSTVMVNVLKLEKSATMKYPASGTVGVIPTSSRNFAILSRFGLSSPETEL